ncbi:MAG: DUF1684 domain-containing protein [Altibacter sp.]|uniref:DUF1684 domain-containing protein n=1 Tax=Altibacter sp. TaxID=2024823 RepID=UPI001DD54914|nr:DUF1684 domain-containing protein [Altibacter sp.]MBZ0327213.1 DUF1684 domain-containing protein [Altibacter sp.]
MKHYIFLIVLLSTSFGISQNTEALIKEIEAYQASENESFTNPETSILTTTDLETFTELEFYPIDLKYRVEATFVRTPNEKPFLMPTTTERLPEYVKYGEAHFTMDGKQFSLELYQNTTPSEDPEYIDYLFLPITDLTSGDGSYGGGRFLDTYIPEGDTMILDFNKLYNPYCAYNKRYSCPIPPKQNDLQVRIEAGVKDFGHH